MNSENSTTLVCPACKRPMLSPADRCSGSFLDEGHPANVAPVVKENPAVMHTDTGMLVEARDLIAPHTMLDSSARSHSAPASRAASPTTDHARQGHAPRRIHSMTGDERPEVYVHAEAPTDDDVRCFYEIPEQLAGHIRTVAPDEPFNSALVKWLTEHQRPVVTEDMVNNAASTLCALGDWLDALSRGDTDRDYPALIAREVIRATFTGAEMAP